MIKAASFLLWKERYARIRELTAQDATLLLGDTSSPHPEWLKAKGFTLQLFGNFRCPIIKTVKRRAKSWIKAFGKAPRPKLPFRFGYGDCQHQHHLILGTRG
jgi:hypothetical protein